MVFEHLRAALRPIVRTLTYRSVAFSSPSARFTSLKPDLPSFFGSLYLRSSWIPATNAIHNLTDTRMSKRRPSLVAKRKHAILKPKGPIAWVQAVAGVPIPVSQPNKGSHKERNEKKRRKLKHDFIVILDTLAEIQERRDTVRAVEKKILELNQV